MIPVLHVVHKFDRRAGPDLLVSELLHRLDRRIWAPSVFLLDFGLFEGPSLLETALPADVAKGGCRWNGARGLPAAIASFAKMCRETGAQVVHSHDIPSHLISLPYAAGRGPVRIASVHGIVDQTRRQRQWNWLMRRLVARLDHTIVSSGPVRDALPDLPDARVSTVMNAIDVAGIAPRDIQSLGRRRHGDDPLRLLCVGRLSEEKGHAHLIAAMRLLVDAPVRLDIVGSGPLDASLRALAADLPAITFHGFAEDTAPHFSNADVFVLASIRESLSIGVLEAMAYGLPVLSTDVGAHPTVVGHSGAGWIVPRQDPAALAAALRLAISRPDLLPDMARRGIAKVHADHSMPSFVARTASIYQAALAARG